MIRKYNDFISESKYNEIESEYHTIGEYIEKVSKDNDYLINIISNYINDVDTDIRISNAVNLLKDFDKKQLFYRVYNYLNSGEEDKDVDIMTNVVYENQNSEVKAGRNIFTSFLKCLTALGLKDTPKLEEPKEGFLLYYESKDVDVKDLKSVFSRFRSLNTFTDLIEYSFNTCRIYYGIKCDLTFEYGFFTDKNIVVGSFKINKSNLNWLLLLQSPSSMPLKRDIINLDVRTLLLFGKISNEIKNYNINAQSRRGPIIKDDVITFKFEGVGRWDNGKLDLGEYETIKSNFKNWLMRYNWSKDVLINISYGSFWVYFNIKVKS